MTNRSDHALGQTALEHSSLLSQPRSVSTLRTWAVCIFLFVATFLLFSPALNHPFLDYDDPNYVTQNIHVQHGLGWENIRWAFTTGHAANWHPLTWLSHMLDWKLYGDQPRGHHATNIVFHSLNAVLAFLAIRRLTGSFWTSAFTAALFAWHPLRVESVVWVSERKDVLSGFFGLATIYLYAAYAQARSSAASAWLYVAVLVTFSMGLLCKPMLVTLPCVLLLLDFWPLHRTVNAAACVRLILEKIPLFILAVVSSIVTYRVQEAGGAMVSFGLASRVINSIVSVALYLQKFFWPFGLAIGYPYPDHWPVATVAISTAVVTIISLIALVQWRRQSWIVVGWLWCLGMWVPVIGLVKVGLQGMADRYTYLPMIGIELAILWTLRDVFRRANPRGLGAIASVILLACAARTWNQISIWGDQHRLYQHALDVTSDNYLAENYLGSILVNDGQLDEASDHFLRALEIKPDYADARCKLGLIFERKGDFAAAAAQYRRVLADRPDDAPANYHLGELLVTEHHPAEALPFLDRSLRADPEFANTWIAAGVANSQLHRQDVALDCFEHAVVFKPGDDEAHFDLANTLKSLHRLDDALAEYDRAIALNPAMETAHAAKAELLRGMGRTRDAAAEYHAAILLNPNDAEAFFGLGAALEDLGQQSSATQCYEQAVKIDPAFRDAQYNLGVIMLNNNRPDVAAAHFAAAIAAKSDDEPSFIGLGLAESQLGQLQKAIADLGRAVALSPDDADAHDYLGSVYDSAGRRDAALAEYHQVQRINPNYPGLADQLRPQPTTNPQTNPAGGS